MDMTDGRRIRGAATRERALEAASTLFAANGYSATSISMIAEAAGLRSQSLYHAFGSKEGMLAAAMEQAAEQFFGELGYASSAPDPEQAIERLGECFERSPLFLRLFLVLVLERRDGDPSLLDSAIAVRERGRRMAVEFLGPHLTGLEPGLRERLLADIGSLFMMLLDGAFIARQLNEDGERPDQLFKLIAVAIRGTMVELLSSYAKGPVAG